MRNDASETLKDVQEPEIDYRAEYFKLLNKHNVIKGVVMELSSICIGTGLDIQVVGRNAIMKLQEAESK